MISEVTDSATLRAEALVILRRIQEIHDALWRRGDKVLGPVSNEADDVIEILKARTIGPF